MNKRTALAEGTIVTKRLALATVVALSLAGALAGFASAAAPPGPAAVSAVATVPAQNLSTDAQRIVDYLLDDWKKQFRSTSITLAMENLGIEPDDELRLEVGQHFRDNLGLANNLRYWGANNYILSNEEKRIAKYLMRAHETEGRVPSANETAAAIGISAQHLASRFAFMAKAGFLEAANDNDLGYMLVDGYERWGGPLRHNFHTVMIEGEKPFDVW